MAQANSPTSNRHDLYFEAVLQLREVSQEVVDYAEEEIYRLKVKVAKVVTLKNGFDYYLSDISSTKKLGKSLQLKFGGQCLITSSLWGVKKDREVHRVTVLYRGISFAKGSTVIYQGEEFEVKQMVKDILLQNIKTGKKVHVKYENMRDVKTS
ncbi:hypothetical protein COY27_06730 [Candidatus Woesearchaeota archaeon CG_4_10_14_0_2_um_filter_33_13]|nr:MAG: hypothetical protein COY27_06730 [Candidatus Woesearchaeota archaeon CG_4_10_14_0_2_um_filter_33_13]